MKKFDPFQIDFQRSRAEFLEFRALLGKAGTGPLDERKHILRFFRERQHLSALIGMLYMACSRVDRIAYEFDFFGDYAADLVVGNSALAAYTFVEFENAAPDSIFKKAGKKQTLEWSPRFEKGYSQIIDWFWKMDDMARTETLGDRFEGARSVRYQGLLVIGRRADLEPLQQARLEWRRGKVIVDSQHIDCVTFDQLLKDIEERLELIGLQAKNAEFRTDNRTPRRIRLKKRSRRRRQSEGMDS